MDKGSLRNKKRERRLRLPSIHNSNQNGHDVGFPPLFQGFLPPELAQSSVQMRNTLKGTLAQEKHIHSRVLSQIAKARNSLPLEFLVGINLREYILQRGAAVVLSALRRIAFSKCKAAFEKWQLVAEECRRVEAKRLAKAHDRARSASIIVSLLDEYARRSSLKVLVTLRVQAKHERLLERLASVVQVQRCFRRYKGRSHYHHMLQTERAKNLNNVAKVSVFCFVLSWSLKSYNLEDTKESPRLNRYEKSWLHTKRAVFPLFGAGACEW